jgi:hypothetical protein
MADLYSFTRSLQTNPPCACHLVKGYIYVSNTVIIFALTSHDRECLLVIPRDRFVRRWSLSSLMWLVNIRIIHRAVVWLAICGSITLYWSDTAQSVRILIFFSPEALQINIQNMSKSPRWEYTWAQAKASDCYTGTRRTPQYALEQVRYKYNI